MRLDLTSPERQRRVLRTRRWRSGLVTDPYFHKETNAMPEKNMWLVYVALAGLSWGTYVPLIAYGGKELNGNRYGALLCVGVAYVLVAVLLPLSLFLSGKEPWPPLKPAGLIFAGLAGVAGAAGALCVIFAAKAAGGPKAKEYLFIAPLIFGLAPVINTLVSTFWHPSPKDGPFNFFLELPGWKLWLGIVLIGVGAALVLFSKEEAETSHAAKKPAAAVAAAPVAFGAEEAPK
jgi:drug/metabolite transporter (DMT)-like permease